MTKETRIGLLVGLLFIIMFGLVLSELAGVNSMPPAPAAAQDNIDTYAPAAPIEDFRGVGDRGRPARPVASSPATAHVVQTSGADGSAVVEASLSPPAGSRERGGVIETAIRHGPIVLAARRGEPTAPSGPASPPSVDAAVRPPAAPPAAPRRRVYTVQANDNLIRIARKVYGPEHGQLYRRIFQANRHILSSESLLQLGQELVIPPLAEAGRERAREAPPAAGSVAPAASGPPDPVAPRADEGYVELDADQLRRRLGGARSGRASRRVYVVRRGDNLTRIARQVLNDDSPAAVRRLFRANRDRLASPHRLPVGLELVVPI